jgi:hypothetical protein
MRVLVGCEFSQIVTKAFRAKGHEAYSCDVLPTEGNPEWHIQGDVLDILNDGYDLAIFHPHCTYLAVSGNRWMKDNHVRAQQRKEAIEFFMELINAPIEKIAIENPVGIMSSIYRKPDQIIQPWQFGHGETKATCLWLKGLPLLKPTNIVEGREHRIHRMAPSRNRQKERSITYFGIAEAFASQWGNYQQYPIQQTLECYTT